MRASLLVRDVLRAFYLLAVVLLFLLTGCSKPSADKNTGGGTDQAAAAPTPIPPVPDTEHQPCFGCNGTGLGPCRGAGCNNGQLECPGTCLRLNRGVWQHMNVAGHSPSDVWQKFPNGPGQWTYWNQNHVGDVIVVKDGRAINTGKCTTCGGTAKIKCPDCRGTGQQTCDFCEGKKIVPVAWTLSDNPVLSRQPDLIRLKDGRVLLGRVVTRVGTKYTIKTRDGKMFEVQAADILPKTNTVAAKQLQ